MNRYAYDSSKLAKKPRPAKKRWEEYTQTEQEKLIKELQGSNSIAMLIMAAQTLGMKPRTHDEAREKQAKAYSVMILNHVMSSPNDELGSFIHGLVLPAACQCEYVDENRPKLRFKG